MSVSYCHFCDRHVDTDQDVDHFNEYGKCIDESYEAKFDGKYFLDTAKDKVISHEAERKYKPEIEDWVITQRCVVCDKTITNGFVAVYSKDADGKPFLAFCSWDCVQEYEHIGSRWGDWINKEYKQGRRTLDQEMRERE